ncbi:PKD domain-containing protein [Cellulomonas composti]|uniref:PKD domain-containing protein n=1 Tax=Cellulomonas composti TaxID=266130 RepID=A0A511J922_9CELL|nr:PKD domain-containing protein [Cellulomonas composti]GEL94494.1 hypothetical protein CCO02nite_11520 [Cellulomonas composti]
MSRSRPLLALTAAAALALGAATVPPAAADDPAPFTLVVLPDTQSYTKSATNHPIMAAQTQWIVDSRASLGTAFVAQVGDLVEFEDNLTNWDRASQYMGTLDAAGVPNAVLPGNHDMDITTGAIDRFRTYFPPSRYQGAAWTPASAQYGGYLGQNQFGPDAVDRGNADSYSLFSAGGMDFLLLSLEFNATDAALDWARRVLAAHPQRRAIVATHSYVDLSGALTKQVLRRDGGGNSGQAMWDELISTSCNVFLVVSGHFHAGTAGEARRTDTNACGRPVQAVLSDYQERPHGGDGWLRYYTFDPTADEIRAYTYSPTLGQYETDADSQFVLPYAMGDDDPPPPPPPPPPPSGLAADAFTRTSASGWGSADVGGAWSVAGSASRYTVNGGAGRITVPPGSTLTATLAGVQSTSADLRIGLWLDRVPDQAAYLTLSGRVVGTADYGARLKILPTGAVQLHATRTGTVLAGGTVPGLTIAAGARLEARVQVDGTAPTTVRARIWPAGSTEPTAWQVTATDATTALQVNGAPRLSVYHSSSATGGPLVVSFDDLAVSAVGSTPPPPPPPNQAPTARLAVQTDGLTVLADSSTSTDADGTIVARTWAFGDGAESWGVTAEHTYDAPGTYTVELTVTDDDGGVDAAQAVVQVDEQPPDQPLALDGFARTVANGWGSADVGGAWATVGTASRWSVGSGVGRVVVPAGSTMTATLPVTSSALDVTATFALSAVPDATTYLGLVGRVAGTQDYSARIKLTPGVAPQLHLVRSGTVLGGGSIGGAVLAAGDRLHVRLQVQGTSPTTLRARAWRDGTPEPSTWSVVATDTTAALQVAGAPRLSAYQSSSATTGPLTVSWDDVRVDALP